MGINKTEVAKAAGLDIRPPDDLPPGDLKSKTTALARNARQSDIGEQIVRRAAYGKCDLASIIKYLDALRRCGTYHRAALAANLSYSSIRNLRDRDPQFAEEEEMAKQLWIAENIDDPIRKFGIEGVHKVLLNQKTGQTTLGEKVIYPQLALAYARKLDRAYREKVEVDNRHSGGVVVVQAPAMTPEEWAARAASRNQARREVIEGTVRELPEAEGGGTIPGQPASPAAGATPGGQ